MNSDTYTTFKTLLGADSTVSDKHRQAILRVCRSDATANRKIAERMITTKQAAEILCTCVKTVHRYGARGLLTPCRRSQRAIRWRLEEVENLATVGTVA